jgi:hypothetical protein
MCPRSTFPPGRNLMLQSDPPITLSCHLSPAPQTQLQIVAVDWWPCSRARAKALPVVRPRHFASGRLGSRSSCVGFLKKDHALTSSDPARPNVFTAYGVPRTAYRLLPTALGKKIGPARPGSDTRILGYSDLVVTDLAGLGHALPPQSAISNLHFSISTVRLTLWDFAPTSGATLVYSEK